MQKMKKKSECFLINSFTSAPVYNYILKSELGNKKEILVIIDIEQKLIIQNRKM